MTDVLREPDFVTTHQLPAVLADGDIFLTACPGSGKTRAGGVRLARLAEDGVRVAACSYTNVGVEQIRRVLSVDLGRTLGPEHFVGTLHSFLLRYVLYPFGHLATGSDESPTLIGDDGGWPDVVFDGDNRVRMPVSRFRYRPDGTLCVRSVPAKFKHQPDTAARLGQSDALQIKRSYAANGFVSFDDAMYWALRVLETQPELALAVAGRFDELIVDEAQDTSELQLACLGTLHRTGGLRSLVLIGDLEQSISSYTGASRTGCEALAAERGLTHVALSENHRSSQKICNVAVHFSARATADVAVGEHKDCPIDPELLLYPADEPAQAVARFRDRLIEHSHDVADAAVLARGNALVDDLNGLTTVVDIAERPRRLGRAVSALRGADTIGRRDLEAVDRIVAFSAWGSQDLALLGDHERWTVRQATMRLLHGAPELALDLRTWIRQAAGVLGGEVEALVDDGPKHAAGRVLRSASGQEGHVAADVFRPVVRELRAQTIHDIKGESRGAVLVVVDRLRSRKRGAQGALWSRRLTGESITAEEAEELRIAFVALTRARRICALALPSNVGPEVVEAFEKAGFVRLHASC